MNDDELGARLRAFDDTAWDPVAPPALRLPVAPAPVRPRRRRVLRPALAALALLIAGGVGGAVIAADSGPGGATIALASFAGQEPGGARARVDLPGHHGGDVRLRVTGARATPAGHVEELWFMTDERRLMSVGTFVVGADGRADVTFHTGENAYDYRYLDVSVEPVDGDPGHSGESVLRSGRLS